MTQAQPESTLFKIAGLPQNVRKREGKLVAFDAAKIVNAMQRARAAHESILEDLRTTAVHAPWAVVVAHDGILRLLLLDLLGIGIEHFWSFPFKLASVSVLDLAGDVAQLRAHNLDAHVTDLGRLADRPAGAL